MTSMQRQFSRLASPVVLKALRLSSRLTGQKRARVVILNPQGELLLVWETIGAHRWSLPGGGIKRGEDPALAASRELYEELGLIVKPRALRQVAFLRNRDTNIGYDAYIFAITVNKNQLPIKPHNPIEIIEINWFKQDALPTKLSPLIRPSLEQLSK